MPTPLDAQMLRFLTDLKRNNDRTWFQAHRDAYESSVREPLRAMIRDLEPRLHALSPHLVVDDARTGGSLFRIHRDTRFARDKSPYKTWAAMRFAHDHTTPEVNGPGYYLHIEPGNTFAAAGVRHPGTPTLSRIRDAIVDDPAGWRKATGGAAFSRAFELGGESLKRAPRGYDPEHPLVDDLKRKDFIAVTRFEDDELLARGFATDLLRRYRLARPMMAYLAAALDFPW